MKQFFINLLKTTLGKLDPEVEFPSERLNYRKCVDAINNQSKAGRQSFYSILLSRISEEDKNYILTIFHNDQQKTNDTHKGIIRPTRVPRTIKTST